MFGGDGRRCELASLVPRLRLRTLAFADCPLIRGELTLPPTNVLVLMAPGVPITDPALEVGRD